jgi:hypothetical protein
VILITISVLLKPAGLTGKLAAMKCLGVNVLISRIRSGAITDKLAYSLQMTMIRHRRIGMMMILSKEKNSGT